MNKEKQWQILKIFLYIMVNSKSVTCLELHAAEFLNSNSQRFSRSSAAAAAAKSLQLYPTLCDPIDSSPPGSLVPGILQARTLEWVAISFSNAWKWKVKVKSLSHGRLFTTSWTAAHQAPLSMGFSHMQFTYVSSIWLSDQHSWVILALAMVTWKPCSVEAWEKRTWQLYA